MIADHSAPREPTGNTSPALDRTPPPRSPAESIFIGDDGLRAGWSLLLYILLIGILIVPTVPLFRHHALRQAAAHRLAPAAHPDRALSDTVTEDGALFLVVLLSSLTMSYIESRPFAAYGIGRTPGALRQLSIGLAWGILFAAALVLILNVSHLLVFDGRLLSGLSAWRYGAEWGFGFLIVGLFEEFFLRGFLLFTLARGLAGLCTLIFPARTSDTLGFWTAATIFACLFGFSHQTNPGESPLGLVSAGLIALIFSLSLWRTGSLWWAIGFHAAWDWSLSFLFGVADSGVIMEHRLLASHPVGRLLLSGGSTGPEGSLFILPVLALITLVVWITLPARRRPFYLNAATPSPTDLTEPHPPDSASLSDPAPAP